MALIAYIDKWFDLSPENVMVKLIGLYEELSFTDLVQVVAALKMTVWTNSVKSFVLAGRNYRNPDKKIRP